MATIALRDSFPRARPSFALLQNLARRWSWNFKVDPISGLVEDKDTAKTYQAIIGVEIHAQLAIPTKLFSPATVVDHKAPPNSSVHPYDAAVPGFLPSLSGEAVQKVVVAARALGCTLQNISRFERKHYAYADLPHAYQITQQRWPIATGGSVTADYTVGKKKKKKETVEVTCRINRIQLEQDSGKTIQNVDPNTGHPISQIDLNRAGLALIEVVSEPDMKSPPQVMAVVEHIRELLKHVNVCDGKMASGNYRIDVNVNLEDQETGERSARCEIKNLNSLKQISEAVTYELGRHTRKWPTQEETRTWNVTRERTELIRRKDQAEDYRFMPEPDLPPLVLNEAVFEGLGLTEFIQQRAPELPRDAVKRLVRDYQMQEKRAKVIVKDPPAIPFLDEAIAKALEFTENTSEGTPRRIRQFTANLVSNDLFGLVKKHNPDQLEYSVSMSVVTPEQIGELVAMFMDEKISSTVAKNVLRLLFEKEKGKKPSLVVEEQELYVVKDPDQLAIVAMLVIADHLEQAIEYREGRKNKILKFFMGEIMRETKGRAHPDVLKSVLQDLLDKDPEKEKEEKQLTDEQRFEKLSEEEKLEIERIGKKILNSPSERTWDRTSGLSRLLKELQKEEEEEEEEAKEYMDEEDD